MTEENAKKCWCRHGRLAHSSFSHNRNGDGSPASFCLGSKCMHWEWDLIEDDDTGLTELSDIYGGCGA